MKDLIFPLIQSLKKMKSQTLALCSQPPGIAIPCSRCKNAVTQPENHLTDSTCLGLDPGKGLQYVCSPFGTRKHRKLKYNFSEQMFSFHISLYKSIFCMTLANLPASQLPSNSFQKESTLKRSSKSPKDQLGFCLHQRADLFVTASVAGKQFRNKWVKLQSAAC